MLVFSWRRFGTFVLLGSLAFAAMASILPDNPYQRYSSLEKTIHNRLRWIYERIHYDETPIDIAIIGPSRSEAAISAPRLHDQLLAVNRVAGVVNFSLPESGRDLHWVIGRELLSYRNPKLMVIVVTEKPGRFGHPAYKYIAPSIDVIDPAFIGNLDYLSNIAYLPYRQLMLFGALLVPQAFDFTSQFDRKKYAGTLVDSTVSFVTGNGIRVERERVVPIDVLEAGVRSYEKGLVPPLLGGGFADQEFGNERFYIRRLVTDAHKRGASVVFLFIPYYKGPRNIQERSFYEQFGPVLDAGFISNSPQYFSDYGHLNRDGAIVLSDWLAAQLADLLPSN